MAREILVNDGEFVGREDENLSSNHDSYFSFVHKDTGIYVCGLWGEEVENLWEAKKLEDHIEMMWKEVQVMISCGNYLIDSGSEDIPF